MKKLIYILALCLCLNGTAALAAEVEQPAAAEPPAQQALTEPTEAPAESAEPSQAPEEAEPPEAVQADKPAADVVNGDGQQGDGQQGDGQQGDNQQDGNQQDGNQQGDGQQGDGQQGDGQQGDGQQGDGQQGDGQQGDGQQGDGQQGDGQQGDGQQGDESGAGAEPGAEADAIPEDAEAWFEKGGKKIGGTLEDMLAQVDDKATIYVRVGESKRALVKAAPLRKLSGLTLEPDKEVFKSGEVVYVSTEAPDKTTQATLIDPADYKDEAADATAQLYFWAEKKDKYKAAETEPEPAEVAAPVIAVAAEHCAPGQWSAEMPAFTLSGIPEGAKYAYAAILYDERIIPLSGNTYAPEEEGQYNLRFAMVDGIGDIVSLSDPYELLLDATAPEDVVIALSETVSYTMTLEAYDSASGVAGVSLDGGATWTALENGETFTYTAEKKTTLSPGAIQVKDVAGNIWRSETEVVLSAVEKEDNGGGGGYGGGGGGSGEGKPAPSHASGDGKESAAYETVALELPDEPMTRLTVGGEAMELRLVLDAAQGDDAPVGQDRPFTARLVGWCPSPLREDAHENVLVDPDAPRRDTLLLIAEPEDALGDEFTYTWRFNGEVYRLLANSGIRYVALQVGDDIAAFPTEGFTGGTKYTELKMLGVSTRKFDYTLTMKVNRNPGYMSALSDSDFSQDCDLSIRAEVENMAYELSSSTNSIMYFYDVYLGPEAMLTQPFGQYKAG